MGAIQSSINTALGVAAIASGLTNKKQVEKAQDKLDKSEEKLANTEAENKDLSAENKDLSVENKKQGEILSATKDEQNMKLGLNAYDVSNDLPTAKATNVDNAGDKSVNVSDKSVNNSLGSSLADYLKYQQKANPFTVEQDMGLRALRMLDSRIAAKKEIINRSKRAMIRARKMGGNE